MAFKDRLREKRIEHGLTQAALGTLVGVSDRTVQKYESGTSTPRNIDVVQRIAQVLHTTPAHLMDSAQVYTLEAQEKGGAEAARDIHLLVSEVSGLFAGGTLDEGAIDGAMRALNEAYWDAKEKNKKYAPKKRGK